MKVLKVTLIGGCRATLFLGGSNFVVHEDRSGHVYIDDGVHKNGGWILHEKYNLDQVVDMIEKS